MKYIRTILILILLSASCRNVIANRYTAWPDIIITHPDTSDVIQLNQQAWNLRKSDPHSALKIGYEALSLSRRIKYQRGACVSLNYIGVFYLKLENYQIASDFFFKALSLSDSIHDEIEKGYAITNIASALLYEHDYPKALEYAKKSLDVQKRIGNKEGMAYSYNRMAEIYDGLRQYDSILVTAKLAYKLHSELGMKESAMIAISNIGRAWEGLKQYDVALRCYHQVADDQSIPKETNLNAYPDIIRLYNKLEMPDSAISYCKKWIDLRKPNADIYSGLSDAYALKQNWKEALKYSELQFEETDSLNREEKYKTLKRLQLMYETSKTNKENAELKTKLYIQRIVASGLGVILVLIGLLVILLLSKRKQQMILNRMLNQKNEEISNQRDRLNELNQTQNRLLSIIAHDLRGPIGSTATYLELLTNREANLSKSEILDNLDTIKDSTKATYNLLENLLTWARAQGGNILFNPQKVNFSRLLKTVLSLFVSTIENKKIQIINLVDSDVEAEFDYDMINAVLRNLINNALKYTKPEGTVTIRCFQDHKFLEVSVSDTGIGMESEIAEIIFQFNKAPRLKKEGTSGEKGTGLGLILCKEFIEIHRGTICAKSCPNEGSTFTFTLPNSQKTPPQ